MKTPNIAILASGSGTTAERFIGDIFSQGSAVHIPLVITNNPSAGVLKRVSQLNTEFNKTIATKIVSSTTHPAANDEIHPDGTQTVAEQRALLALFEAYNIDLVLLLGYMKHIGKLVTDVYGWRPEYTSIYQARMLNTHPGLLPATAGLFGINVQEAVLSNHHEKAGQTLHVVSAEYDEGPTVAENTIDVYPNETAEELFARVQIAEKDNIARDVLEFLQQQANYNGGNHA